MSAPLTIKVGGLHTIDADIPDFRPTHLLGILDPLTPDPLAYRQAPASRVALVLRFRDVDAATPEGPGGHHAAAIIDFADRVVSASRRGEARFLVHCHAGISRSTASAYITLVRERGIDHAADAFAELLRITLQPWPNRSLVELADRQLAAEGRLLAPLDAYRAANQHRLHDIVDYHQTLFAKARLDDGDPLEWVLPRR
jgi:predicted protein tyrosine phosphatase